MGPANEQREQQLCILGLCREAIGPGLLEERSEYARLKIPRDARLCAPDNKALDLEDLPPASPNPSLKPIQKNASYWRRAV